MAAGDPLIGLELGPEFDQGNIQTSRIRLKIGSGLAILPSGTIVATQNELLLPVTFAEGRVAANGNAAYVYGATVTRTNVGRYTVTFDVTHPDVVAYAPLLTPQSDEPNRDQRKIGYTNVSSAGFDVVTTVDDNGGTADTYADIPFSFSVNHRISIVTPT